MNVKKALAPTSSNTKQNTNERHKSIRTAYQSRSYVSGCNGVAAAISCDITLTATRGLCGALEAARVGAE
jgi:hypothetical protein